jgi:hypothetical protein
LASGLKILVVAGKGIREKLLTKITAVSSQLMLREFLATVMPAGYIDLSVAELGDHFASTGYSISKDLSNPDLVVISSRNY